MKRRDLRRFGLDGDIRGGEGRGRGRTKKKGVRSFDGRLTNEALGVCV